MKGLLPIFLALAINSVACAAEPKLSVDQVQQIGKLLIDAKQHEEFLGMFNLDKPTFDSKEGIWRLTSTAKAFSPMVDGPVYFCEIRDSDGHFRIGAISYSGFSPSSSKNFRMPPSLRRKIERILGK